MNLHEHDSFWNREKGIKKLPSTFFSQVHQFPSIYFTMQRHELEFSSLECGNFDKMRYLYLTEGVESIWVPCMALLM